MGESDSCKCKQVIEGHPGRLLPRASKGSTGGWSGIHPLATHNYVSSPWGNTRVHAQASMQHVGEATWWACAKQTR